MAYIKANSQKEQEMFDYLEELRQSGETNMLGAATYLQEEFNLRRVTASQVLLKWMKLHDNPDPHGVGEYQ